MTVSLGRSSAECEMHGKQSHIVPSDPLTGRPHSKNHSTEAGALSPDDLTRLRRILCEHISRYPLMEIRDLYKLIHQGAMGSEHAVSNVEAARSWLMEELSQLADGPADPAVDRISADGQIVRVHLRPFMRSGGDPNLLLAAFVRTANEFPGSTERLQKSWFLAEEMADAKEAPFARSDMQAFFERMQWHGYSAAHHSSAYQQAYRPAYRVVLRRYLSEMGMTE